MSIRAAKILLLLAVAIGCGSKTTSNLRTCDPANPSCRSGEVCEAVEGGPFACFTALHVVGTVFDVQSPATKLDDARVAAFDASGFPMSDVATTANGGQYDLAIRATRDRAGHPVAGAAAMLRADKQGYFSFPSGLRPSLPIDLTLAVARDGKLVVDAGVTNLVDVGLLANAAAGPRSISGSVAPPPSGGGVLVVAECPGAVFTAVDGLDGTFVIYNLPAASCAVQAYTAGVVYVGATADLTAASVTLPKIEIDGATQTGTVSGKLQFVNPGSYDPTSVILVVESTFDASLVRGEAPPGLRAGGLTSNNSSYTIPGVPPGNYVVLAAYENDHLVRDPDPAISGTQIQHITVTPGGALTLQGFKITGALDVLHPGANGTEIVSVATPELSWVDDSSEDEYDVTVLNALGQTVWAKTIPGFSGTDPTLIYGTGGGATPLEASMTYQFKVVSIKFCTPTTAVPDGRCPISTTEDLKGVFVYRP